MSAWERELTVFWEEWELLPPGAHVLAAVSGGMDSMCLLHLLCARGYRVTAAHFNHRLRGEASDADERFVADWCAAHGVACVTGAGDVAAEAARNGETVEEAARALRYAFLERTADAVGAQRIATAHHAQDSAETALLNLARGTGADGLGIPPVRGRIVRPLLLLTRERLAQYAQENGIPWRTDTSNENTEYRRNFVRHEIMPLLRAVNPAAVEHIAEAALRLRRESAYLDALAREYLTGLTKEGGAASLPCRALREAPPVLHGRMLRLLLDELPVGKKDFSARHYAALEALREGGQLDLPQGVVARRRDDTLYLTLRAASPEEAPLRFGEATAWGDYFVRLSGSGAGLRLRAAPDDAWTVGRWSARERLTLPGKSARSVKRLFTERGIDPAERERTPVVRVNGALAAVCGLGVDASFAAEPGEDSFYVLNWEKRETILQETDQIKETES